MITIFIIIALVLMLLGWPLLPGAIKHSDQDKRRAEYQKSLKEKRLQNEQKEKEEEE